MMRLAALKCTALVALFFLTLTVTSCGSGEAGPLQALSEGGQPIVDGASVMVRPGYPADFTAFLFNPLKSPVRLLSATIVPVTGHFLAARLLHVGIGTTVGIAGASSGWPLRYVPTRPLAGGLIRHGQSNIIFAVTGPVSGRNYYVAGLKIRYEYRAHIYYVVAWSAAVACVTARYRDPHFAACPGAGQRTQAIVENMAKHST
jgi:hypothetical protein